MGRFGSMRGTMSKMFRRNRQTGGTFMVQDGPTDSMMDVELPMLPVLEYRPETQWMCGECGATYPEQTMCCGRMTEWEQMADQ